MPLKLNEKHIIDILNKRCKARIVTVWHRVNEHGKDVYMLMADDVPMVYTGSMEEMNLIFDFEKGLFKSGALTTLSW